MKRTNRTGQVQMGETIAVVVIIIILITIGIVFWNGVQRGDIQKSESQSQELSVIEIANIVPGLQELKCYKSSVSKVNCIDWYKVRAMNNMTMNNSDKSTYEYYNYFFKSSRITIVKIYPVAENITIYDSKLSNNSKTLLISLPVNIQNENTDPPTISYGLIMVEGYYNE